MSDYFLKIMHYLIVSAQSYFMLSKIPKCPTIYNGNVTKSDTI